SRLRSSPVIPRPLEAWNRGWRDDLSERQVPTPDPFPAWVHGRTGSVFGARAVFWGWRSAE
ncbi:MAG TPA: hypothetical protein VD767_10130, partial [Thermomicrobiales bacterium]|nr:hypothetical protein [Thermomicrobiales bacterium]